MSEPVTKEKLRKYDAEVELDNAYRRETMNTEVYIADAVDELIERLTRERDQFKQVAELNAETIKTIQSADPDYGTPNWCPRCSPKRQGYCSCEIACNG